jgi:hypothetical protein
MPNKLVAELSAEVKRIKDSLQTHLDEGVEIKLAIARLQVGLYWVGVLGLVILTAVAGIYFKK